MTPGAGGIMKNKNKVILGILIIVGGLAIAAGYGWTSTGWVGSLLALGGLAILGLSVAVERRTATRLCPST